MAIPGKLRFTYSEGQLLTDALPQVVGFYRLSDGRCPFVEWLESLRDRRAASKVKRRLDRLELGSFGDFKPVGGGVFELRIDYGPGYRVYFARKDDRLILLLCGGDKKTQNKDILRAKQYWIDFQSSENESL